MCVVRDPREALTADGMIRTGARRDRVPAAFAPILDDVVHEVRLAASPDTELHLYGSVATGMARVAESDVDLLLINGPEAWANEVSARLSRTYADVPQRRDRNGEELGLSRRRRRGLRQSRLPPAALLRISGRPGRDPHHEPFAGDAQAARGFNGDIVTHLAHWRTGATSAQAIVRKSLVAAAGVVSIRNRTWTTDRAAAARAWVEVEQHGARRSRGCSLGRRMRTSPHPIGSTTRSDRAAS